MVVCESMRRLIDRIARFHRYLTPLSRHCTFFYQVEYSFQTLLSCLTHLVSEVMILQILLKNGSEGDIPGRPLSGVGDTSHQTFPRAPQRRDSAIWRRLNAATINVTACDLLNVLFGCINKLLSLNHRFTFAFVVSLFFELLLSSYPPLIMSLSFAPSLHTHL